MEKKLVLRTFCSFVIAISLVSQLQCSKQESFSKQDPLEKKLSRCAAIEKKLASLLNTPALKAIALTKLAEKYAKSPSFPKAVGFLENAYNFAQTLEDTEEKNQALAGISNRFAYLNQPKRAIQIADEISNQEVKGELFMQIFFSFQDLGKGDRGVAQFASAILAKLNKIQEPNKFADGTTGMIGLTYIRLGELDLALQTVEMTKNNSTKAELLEKLSKIYMEKGDGKKAASLSKTAKEFDAKAKVDEERERKERELYWRDTEKQKKVKAENVAFQKDIEIMDEIEKHAASGRFEEAVKLVQTIKHSSTKSQFQGQALGSIVFECGADDMMSLF